MQITVNNDFTTYQNATGHIFTQQEINSFIADENTAINILDSTFTSNISVVFNVGFGSYSGGLLPNQNISEAETKTPCFS
jgi:hypothetical protein